MYINIYVCKGYGQPWYQRLTAGADPGFQVRGGGGGRTLKKFRVKNHDLTPKKILFFPILGGGGRAPGAPPPPPPGQINNIVLINGCFNNGPFICPRLVIMAQGRLYWRLGPA